MSKYIEVETPSGLVFMEVDDLSDEDDIQFLDVGGRQLVSGTIEKVSERFNQALNVLAGDAKLIINKLRNIDLVDRPDEIEVSFNIKAAGEVGNTIFALAKGSVEAGYNVTIKWKREDPKPAAG